ncbi:MAG: type II toxin-antitoxin system HicB family antitoxin [Ardenticatenaceae bacterium]
MKQLQTLRATLASRRIIEQEDDGFVALCPQLDIASQGDSIQEAKSNLTEAIELFLEVAHPSEIQSRLHRNGD